MMPDVLKGENAGQLISALKSMVLGSKVEDLAGICQRSCRKFCR